MSPFGSLVLCYHALSDEWDHPLAVRHVAFRRQVELLLRRRWRPVAGNEVLTGVGRGFHVTFDDAFASILPGLMTLEQLHVPATIFACSSFARDGGCVFDVPELAAEASSRRDELRTIGWDGLRDLAARGFEIGAHTHSHPHLPSLSDRELELELRDAKAQIEDELAGPCRFLAYPYGDEDPRVRAAAEQAGYLAAFALPGSRSDRDLFAIPRVGIYRRDGLPRAWAKTSPLVDRLRSQVRR
jgi:peptidoglycan/xylan/chitin deacetylase (PgdA/CDA1 family)